MHPFRAAIEARDVDAAVELLADDVVFRSPVVFTPYRGRATVKPIIQAVATVFEDFRYVREIGEADAADHGLVFEARVGDRRIEGIDLIHVDDAGAIGELVVMVRPLSAMLAFAEAMRTALEGPSAGTAVA